MVRHGPQYAGKNTTKKVKLFQGSQAKRQHALVLGYKRSVGQEWSITHLLFLELCISYLYFAASLETEVHKPGHEFFSLTEKWLATSVRD